MPGAATFVDEDAAPPALTASQTPHQQTSLNTRPSEQATELRSRGWTRPPVRTKNPAGTRAVASFSASRESGINAEGGGYQNRLALQTRTNRVQEDHL